LAAVRSKFRLPGSAAVLRFGAFGRGGILALDLLTIFFTLGLLTRRLAAFFFATDFTGFLIFDFFTIDSSIS
jgi:hypothetical protein